MKAVLPLAVLGAILSVAASAQDSAKPTLKAGVSVQMPVAAHAVEVRAADEEDATVVALTAGGKLYVGIKPAEIAALASLTADPIYVKADARAPFQNVLAVLDALRGKSVVLLAAAPADAPRRDIQPPYGIRLSVPR